MNSNNIEKLFESHLKQAEESEINSMAGAAIPLALVLAGPIVSVVGLRSMYFNGGGIVLLIIAGLFSKDLLDIEDRKMQRNL